VGSHRRHTRSSHNRHDRSSAHRPKTTAATTSLVSSATAYPVIELGKISARTCVYALLVVTLAAGVVAIATENDFALAQQPCQVQLGSPNLSTQQYYFYGGNFQLTLPVSASCSFYAGQLYATASAYDTTYGTNVGIAQTVLSSTYGGYGYIGQLTFTMPTSVQGHLVQFYVSVYGSQNGYYGGYYGSTLLAQTSPTFIVAPTYYQGYPTYPSYPTSPSYQPYPNYPSYYYGPNYYGYYSHYRYYCRSWNNNYCYRPPR